VPLGSKDSGGWRASDWLNKRVRRAINCYNSILREAQEERNMALFAQYAMAAAQEAVEDAALDTLSEADCEKVVRGLHT
jgi:3-oxoacyl-[acyl-carrier-protein] synthase II